MLKPELLRQPVHPRHMVRAKPCKTAKPFFVSVFTLVLACLVGTGSYCAESAQAAPPPLFTAASSASGTPAAAEIYLPVEVVLQNPQLPNGCEATSLAMLLQYHGFAADKTQLAYEYIPRQDFSVQGEVRFGPAPEDAYAGDPATKTGFYCFAKPIAQGANRILTQAGSALQCRDMSGSTDEDWVASLASGVPVMVWVTLDFSDTAEYMAFCWQLPSGKTYTPFKNLHCVVLAGFDETSFYISDPLQGSLVVSRREVYQSYLALGSHAAVIR